MTYQRKSWQEELEIIDRTMKAISGITDPEELITTYFNNIGALIPGNNYISLSRRDVTPPNYLITRSSQFKENFNPWKQRDRLPKMAGGILGEVIYLNQPT